MLDPAQPQLVYLLIDFLSFDGFFQAANARERRRMSQMTKAYLRLKERLPNSSKIQSKKQIVDKVSVRPKHTL